MSDIRLLHGDCIELMQKLHDNDIKVDMVLTDPPYGTTYAKWDEIIDFNMMWDVLNPLCYKDTPVLLFGVEPFSSLLRVSNLKCYKYDWVWNKENSSNFLSAKYQPLRPLEYISVFYRKAPYYNPIRRPKTIDYDGTRTSEYDMKYREDNSEINRIKHHRRYYIDDGTRYPINLLTYNNQSAECNNVNRVHPTQKPVALLEYLIKTYTEEGDVVLDFTMGSGSTGVACKGLNRDFIGIELDEGYYNIAHDRIRKTERKLCN